MTTEIDTEQIIRDATTALAAKFPDHRADDIERVVAEELARFEQGTVQDYLSVLTVRAARRRLSLPREAQESLVSVGGGRA